MTNLYKEYLNDRGFSIEGHKYVELTEEEKVNLSRSLTFDAQPALQSTPNAGILNALTTYIDPKVIEYLFAPLVAVQVAGSESKKGTYLDTNVVFITTEYTGYITSYDDYNNDGISKTNYDYPQRQPYLYQTITKWGYLETERAGRGKLDWISQVNISSLNSLNRYQNKTYFFGVEGLQNYGLLNDPFLPASIAPINVGGNILWSAKDANQIYNDVLALYTQLAQVQSNANVNLTTKMTLAVSSYGQAQLAKPNLYGLTAKKMIEDNFPNLEIVVAPEMKLPSGELVRLKAQLDDGQLTEECSFTDKLKAFAIVQDLSAFSQKKMQTTNGAIIYRPILIASMLGV